MKRAIAALTVFLLGCQPVGSALTPIFFADDPKQPEYETQGILWVQAEAHDPKINVAQPNTVDKDYTEEFYRWSAESGYPQGQEVYGLLLIYDRGQLISGLDWLHQSLEQGYVPAALDLSWLFMKGQYVEQNLSLALQYLEPAMHAEEKEAFRLAAHISLLQENTPQAMHYLEQAAALGDQQSQRDLAQLIVEEKRGSWRQAQSLMIELQNESLMGETQDLKDFWPTNPHQSATPPVAPQRPDHPEKEEGADPHSMLPLPYTPSSYPSSFQEQFETYAEKGSPYAAYQAALQRLNVPTDKLKALSHKTLKELLDQAATVMVPAQVLKARLILREYFPGHGPQEAYALLEKAAEQNNLYALFAMSAWMREQGQYELSVDYYNRAMSQQNIYVSLYHVVWDLTEGYYPFWQEELAFDWLFMLAQDHYNPALLLLADLKEEHRLPGTQEEVFVHRYQAAWQGDPQAQYIIGNMYLRGDFVMPNPQKAFRWFYQSAYRGYRPAQYQLALQYEKGIGILPDIPKAYAWRRVARLGLYENDEHELVALVNQMNQSQLDRALQLEKVYDRNFVRPWIGRRAF